MKEARRPHMEDLFTTLAAAGIARDDLYLAWDFTVASERNLTERLLFIRDDALRAPRLGGAGVHRHARSRTNVDGDASSAA